MRILLSGVTVIAVVAALAACQPVKTVTQAFDPSPEGIVKDTKGQFADATEIKGKDYLAYQAKVEREMTVAMTDQRGRLEVQSIQDYANSVMTKIARAAEERLSVTNFQPKVVISAPHAENAFATPSGAVIITRGLIESLKNEDQLAFVLAHEAAHVLLGHHDNDWVVKTQRHTLTTAEIGMQALSSLSQAAGKGNAVNGEVQKYRMIASGALILSRDFIMPRFSQKNETEADLLGIDLMVAAGYTPRAASDVGKLLGTMETAASDDASISAERDFGEWWDETQKSNSLFGEFMDDINKAYQKERAESRKKHADPKERLAAIKMYARREYRKIRTPMRSRPYETARNRKTVKSVRTHYDQAAKAITMMNKKQTKSAISQAGRGAKGSAHNHSYPLLILNETNLVAGRKTQARRALVRALNGPNPSLEVYLRLSQSYAKKGDLKRAVKVAEYGRKRYGESAPMMIHTISLRSRAGQKSKARALVVDCKLSFPSLEKQCEDGLKGDFGAKKA